MFAVPAVEIRQYTGSNSGDIVDWLNNGFNGNIVASITSEAAGVLTLSWECYGGPINGGGEGTTVINSTDWIHGYTGAVTAVTDADFTEKWAKA